MVLMFSPPCELRVCKKERAGNEASPVSTVLVIVDDADYYVGDNYNDDRNPDRCKHPPPAPVNYANQFQDDKDHGEYIAQSKTF